MRNVYTSLDRVRVCLIKTQDQLKFNSICMEWVWGQSQASARGQRRKLKPMNSINQTPTKMQIIFRLNSPLHTRVPEAGAHTPQSLFWIVFQFVNWADQTDLSHLSQPLLLSQDRGPGLPVHSDNIMMVISSLCISDTAAPMSHVVTTIIITE